MKSLKEVIEAFRERAGDPAVIAFLRRESEVWSYADLAGHVDDVAGGLAVRGISRGDRVALLAGNSPAWIAAALGAIRSAAQVVPIDTQLADDVLGHVLTDSSPSAIFTTPAHLSRLQKQKLKDAPTIFLLSEEGDTENAKAESWRTLSRADSGELPEIAPDDVAVLFYTSGTTGRPKGVPLTHANVTSQFDLIEKMQLASPDDRILLPLPLHHVYPFVAGMLAPLAIGATVVLPQALTGPQLTRALREGDVTAMIGVPRLYRALVDGLRAQVRSKGRISSDLFTLLLRICRLLRRRLSLRAGDLLLKPVRRRMASSLRTVASGGSALDPDLAWTLEALGWRVATGYGLTETSPLLTVNAPGDARFETAGRAIEGVELRIDREAAPEPEEGDDGGDSRDERLGEVVARGPNVFAGYHNLPDETKDAFTSDGWFRTGDLGWMDDDGFLHLAGRLSTLIVTEGGKNIQPDEVEEVYAQHPAIREAGVLQTDEGLVALIMPQQSAEGRAEESSSTVDEAVQTQSRQLPSYQRIADFRLTSEPLPRTRLGKIQRHKLKERWEEAGAETESGEQRPMPIEEMTGDDRELMEDAAARRTWEWLSQRFPNRRVTPSSNLQMDLGVDSMEWLNLTMDISQHAGVELDEAAISRVETVRDLLSEVVEASAGEGAAAPSDVLDDPEAALDEEQKRWLRPLSAVQRRASSFMFALDRLLMRVLFRLEVKGVERLPREGPIVLAPNHLSYLDAPAIAAALPRDRLEGTWWAGWTGMSFRNPLMRLISRLSRTFPVDPKTGARSSLAYGAVVLQQERSLAWFPEGQRSQDGTLQEFRAGLGLLLERHPVPVVPVLIEGAHTAWPPGRLLPRSGHVTVTFGDPLDPHELQREGADETDGEMDDQEAARRMMSALRSRMEALSR